MSKYYVPVAVINSRPVTIKYSDGSESELEIPFDWANGMQGVLPLFDSLESARAYAGDSATILEFEATEKALDKDVDEEKEADTD